MGLTRNKISVRREERGDQRVAFIDFYKAASKTEFKSGFLKDFIGDNLCFAFIDSSLAYQETDVNKSIEELYQYLDRQAFNYRRVMTTEDYTANILGIQIKSYNKKRAYHKIGIIISSKHAENLLSVNKFNITLYMRSNQADQADPEEILNRFQAAHGEMETLEDYFDLQLYLDDFMSVVKLTYPKEYADVAEQLISGYISTK